MEELKIEKFNIRVIRNTSYLNKVASLTKN
nr:MAG TPA: hypothetical protein [Caudoviricetes sp.]